MKKLLVFLMVTLMFVFCFCGCKKGKSDDTSSVASPTEFYDDYTGGEEPMPAEEGDGEVVSEEAAPIEDNGDSSSSQEESSTPDTPDTPEPSPEVDPTV